MVGERQGGDRAVSKVVGNVLMVAVVVILASLIGPFAYDLAGQATQSPPAGVFEFSTTSDGDVVITYEQGRAIEANNLRLEGEDPDGNVSFGPWPAGGTLTSGESVTVPDADGDETLRIIWSTGGDREFILAKHEF